MKNKSLTLATILLIPIGIAMNFIGGQIAVALKLPVYLDIIGNVLVGALAGPWVGLLSGVASNLILGITNPSFIPYAIVSGAIGFVSGFCGKWGWFKDSRGLIKATLLIWIVTQITSVPITVLVYGGVTGSGTTLVTAFFVQMGQGLWQSVISTSLITETVDKLLSVIIVYIILKSLPKRTMLQFPLGDVYVDKLKSQTKEDEWS